MEELDKATKSETVKKKPLKKDEKETNETLTDNAQFKKQQLIVATCADVGFKKYAPKKSKTKLKASVMDLSGESQGQSSNTKTNLNIKKKRRIDFCNDPSNFKNLKIIEQNIKDKLKKKKKDVDPEEARRFWHKQDVDAENMKKIHPDVCLCGPTTSDLTCPNKPEICDKSIKKKKSKADQFKTWLKADTYLFNLKSKRKRERGGPVFFKKIKHLQKKKITSETCICEPGKFDLPQKGKSKNRTDKIKSVIQISCPFTIDSKKKKKDIGEKGPKTCICNRLNYIPTQKAKKIIKKSSEPASVIEITCPGKLRKMKEDKKNRIKKEKEEKKLKKKMSKQSKICISKPKKVKVEIKKQLDSDDDDDDDDLFYNSSCELSDESFDESTSSLDESLSESLDKSLSESSDESVSESLDESISESVSESVDESLSVSKRAYSKVHISPKKKTQKNAKLLKRPKERKGPKIIRKDSIKTEQGTGDADILRPVIQTDQIKPKRTPKIRTRKVGPKKIKKEKRQKTERKHYNDTWFRQFGRYIRRKIRRCIDKDKKMVTCKCRPKLTKKQELSAYRCDFRGKFRDGLRMIDLIIVVKDDGDRNADRLRMKFLVAALKTGLEFELENGIMPVNNHLIFIKVHGPPDVIDRYGEAYGIRRFYRQQHLYCTHQPEREFIRIVRQNYPSPPLYSSLDRSLIVYKIFLHLPYGRNFEDYGIHKLIALDIFRDAYALHDGPAFLVNCQNPSCATARQILFHNWAQALWFRCFRSMPFSLIQEYMGDRVAYYFAFAEYYNRALMLLGFTSIIFLILQGSRWYLFLSKDADEAIQAFCNDTIITGAKACPECVHDKNVCVFKNMRSYCETYKYYYRLLDDGRLKQMCRDLESETSSPSSLPKIRSNKDFKTTLFTHKWKVRERKLRWKWENSKELAKAELRPMHRKLPAVYKDYGKRTAYYSRIFISTLLSASLVIIWMAITHMFLLEKGPFKELMEIFRGYIENLVWKNIFGKKWDSMKELDVFTVGNMFFTSLLYALAALPFGVICKWTAYFLANCERHTVFALYERSLAKKLFMLSAVTVFPLMVYHCFLKIIGLQMLDEAPWLPTVAFLNINLFKLFHIEPFFSRNCGPSGSCLHQISAILLATWIVFQLVYPIIKYIFRWLFNVKDWRRRVPVWETEYLLPPMTDKMIMDRYDSLITQFGLCTLFVQTFPLLPIFCVMINLYDFRYSARLFLCFHRRPLFPRFSGIGTWRSILTLISYTTLFFHAIVIAYHTVFAENIGFHNYHHEDYTEGFVPLLNPFNKTAVEIDVTEYAKFLVAAFPMWRYNYSEYIRNYTAKLNNKPSNFCLYSGQHRYNYEMTEIICGSECYNVRNIRLQVYGIYLIFFGFMLPLVFTLFDRGFSASQVSIAERRIQRAFYHGDQKRGDYDALDYRYLYCPSGECYKSH